MQINPLDSKIWKEFPPKAMILNIEAFKKNQINLPSY
jgi:hypothetical protein